MINQKMLSASLISLVLTGCAMVELSPEGEKARVLTAAEVTGCQYVGKTTSTTTDKLVGVSRHQGAIEEELVSLARNAASRLGGDTVVAAAEAVEGVQTFLVYRCVPQ